MVKSARLTGLRMQLIKLRIGNSMFAKKTQNKLLSILLACLFLISSCQKFPKYPVKSGEFDGERAYQDLVWQVEAGPRIPGTASHQRTIDWIEAELLEFNWQVEHQLLEYRGKQIHNIIARKGEGEYILLGAHYDTRIYADRDPDPSKRKNPVPGANDGASGVAVLLELARVLPGELTIPIQLVFFDAEDNGGIGDWDWILGSSAFVEVLEEKPKAVIIVDMIGDDDLEIYYEHNSDLELMKEIWQTASSLGYSEIFIPEYKHSMLDDHTPFVQAGITAVDLIDFDYPSWHTTMDTVDKVSAESLKAVGDTLLTWMIDQGAESE